MKIGIIGPSKIGYVEEINKEAKKIISDLAKELAGRGFEIVITPDRGSASEFFAEEYIKNQGKKVIEILPLDDSDFGYKEWVNVDLGEVINCGTWRNQPEKLNEETDILLCIGYAVGVLSEIAYSKWFKPKTVYIINELVSGKLPRETEKSLKLKYISFNDMGEIK
jgi:hypothetical protein